MLSPIIPLAASEHDLHLTAMRLCRMHRKIEWRIVRTLQQIDGRKLFRKFGATSLFKYAVDILGLSESVAYSLISVARKSLEVPALGEAIKGHHLSASKASRIVAALTQDNATQLIEYAKTHSRRDVDLKSRALILRQRGESLPILSLEKKSNFA